jgi:hypothetical protein
VNLDMIRGQEIGVARTPTVIVGEERFIDVFSAGEVIAAIDKALRS